MLTPEMIKELADLERQGGDELRTEAVVQLAQNPSSALHAHPAFEWDVRKAAYKQWMEAARHVVQVFVGIVRDNGDEKTMRRYVHVYNADDHQPVYRATQTVLLENRRVIVNAVADRILSAIRSYPLREFDPVVELVEQIRADANSPEAGVAERSTPQHGAVEQSGGKQSKPSKAKSTGAQFGEAERSGAKPITAGEASPSRAQLRTAKRSTAGEAKRGRARLSLA